LGSLAVFITLAYLSMQVRHARSDSQRALSQGRTEAVRELNSLFVDEKVRTSWEKALIVLEAPLPPDMTVLMERAKLTHEEAIVVGVVARMNWGYKTQTIPYVDELPAIERDAFEKSIRRLYGPNGGPHRVFYETNKSMQHPDAVRYVDNLLAQPG
jgi:hypothetical protein